jgi:integrase
MVKAGLWKACQANTKVLDFATLQDRIEEDEEDTLRMPWREAHFSLIFASPLYTGNQGPKKRLLEGTDVHHDAAYWVPLLIYYSLGTREEICGLELADVEIDAPVPYIYIRKNAVRDLKRKARKRKVPVHPELLRLGFREYVEALRNAEQTLLFPELYANEAKFGGAQFYAICWTFLMNWLSDRIDIPKTLKNKEADIHSIRTFGASLLDQAAINQNVVKDIMGHARTGVTATAYQKRDRVVAEETTLEERLTVLETYLPRLSGNIPARRLSIMPVTLRSRCGSSRSRKVRTPCLGKSTT